MGREDIYVPVHTHTHTFTNTHSARDNVHSVES
jgi:hypothetical protein